MLLKQKTMLLGKLKKKSKRHDWITGGIIFKFLRHCRQRDDDVSKLIITSIA